jgi:protease II
VKINRFLFLISAATAPALINLPATELMSQTAKKPVSNEYQGTTVEDPYQWLEKDNDPEVKAWSDAHNQRTRDYLDKVPDRQNDRAPGRSDQIGQSDILRTSSSAGHGQDTALSERIKQLADIYSFLFARLDMSPKGMTKRE